MKGDFSRDTFNAEKHFSRVLQQQGRVQLDADTNEQTAILLHYLRILAADLIGPYGGPVGSDGGFEITIEGDDLCISKGRYYVDGILCENDKNKIKYTGQEDYPLLKDTKLPDKPYLVYLDVWERHITALEDDSIREKALGGPDTATRTKVVWQVKTQTQLDGMNFNNLTKEELAKSNSDIWKEWTELWQPDNRGCLKARLKPAEKSTEPCLVAPDAKYRGQENQLYRIEIHNGGGADEATFKWSRDNGAIVTGCTKDGTKLILDNPRGFTAPGWVELTSKELELRGEEGKLAKVAQIEGNVLTLETGPGLPQRVDEESTLWVRRWESDAISVRKNPAGPDDNGWIELENGIEIQFQKNDTDNDDDEENAHQYRTGDYWLIPARVATGDIEWPESDEKGVPPFGIEHHYAPLAVIEGSSLKEDLRFELKPLGETTSPSDSQ